MKIVIVSFSYDKKFADEEELLECYYTTTGWAEALQRRGAEVTVVSRFFRDRSFHKNNVQYNFIKDGFGETLRTRNFPLKFLKRISRLDADIIHLHHLSLSMQTFLLRMMLNKKTAIVIQHHGGKPPGKIKRMFFNFFNRAADGFFFTSAEQGLEWFMKKNKFEKILPVMEGATFFNFKKRNLAGMTGYYERNEARKNTGMKGSPVFLWVGRLDDNKDPLTVLSGFDTLSEQYPDAILYMIYSNDKLPGKVKEKINSSGRMKKRVRLLGNIEHSCIEQYYNSADYFVLGSHSEGSGYALSEAMRCGCVPVVTAIPSFKMMTDNGQLGALWQPGNKIAFVRAAVAAMNKPLEQEAKACIDFFQNNLSFDAIAKTAMEHYQKLINQR